MKMDSQAQNSLKESNSLLMRCSCLFSFIFLTILLSSFVILILVILKPKKPYFHLHSIHLGHINLNTSSGKDIFFPPSIASVIFLTENSNKFGIRYSSSDLGVIYEDNPVGIVAVPAFYQPPHGRNVTVIMHVLLQRINITKFLNTKANSNGSSSNGSEGEVQIAGKVRAKLHVFNFSLPTIKVLLDCRIQLNYGSVAISKGIRLMNTHMALVLSKFPHICQKCSLTLF